MPGFDEDSAKRIAQSVRYTERLQGVPSTDPNENYGTAIGGQICLVQTDATLPGGYNGAMGAPGQVIEKQSDGTINKLGAIWIKDQNGGTLSANTIYQARIGGTWTQDVTTNGIVKPTTLGLYLVQLPTMAADDHFRPYGPGLSNNNIIYVNYTYYMIINNFAVMNWGPYILSDYYGTFGASLTLFMRNTKRTIEYNKNKYEIYEWYSSEEWVTGLVKIYYTDAMKFDGSTYNVQVLNPWIYGPTYNWGQPSSGVTSLPTGYFSCKYRINPGYRPYNYYTQFADQLVCVAKIAELPTTGGIGSGIGSGISGV